MATAPSLGLDPEEDGAGPTAPMASLGLPTRAPSGARVSAWVVGSAQAGPSALLFPHALADKAGAGALFSAAAARSSSARS